MFDPRFTSLVDVGFTEKEARIFTALSELGEATASQIALRAQLKRPIVYLTLEKLVKQGTVLELPKQRIKRYAAIEPTKLVRVLESNVEHLRLMLPLFRAFQRQHGQKPQIEIFETKDSISSVFRMLEEAKISRYYGSYARLQELFPAEVERWRTRGADLGYKNESRRLCVDEPEGRAMAKAMSHNKRQLFCFLPKNVQVGMDLSVSDDMFVITHFNPLFALVIRSAELVRSVSIIYDLAWKQQGGKS